MKLLKMMHQLSISLLSSSNYQTTYSLCEIKHFVKQAKSCLESSLYYTFYRFDFIISERGDMSNFMGVGIFWIGLNRTDLGCWRLTLKNLHAN